MRYRTSPRPSLPHQAARWPHLLARRSSAAQLMLVSLALGALLLGCGNAGASAQTNSQMTPRPGSPTLNGCALQHPPTNPLLPANVILTDGATAVTVNAGIASPVSTTEVESTPPVGALTPPTFGGGAASGAASGTPLSIPPFGSATVPPLGQQVTAHVGQTIEIRLRASVAWSLVLTGAHGVLSAHSTLGWYDVARQVCVWRFVATHTGAVQLSFTGGLVCPQNAECPALAAFQVFDVAVTSPI